MAARAVRWWLFGVGGFFHLLRVAAFFLEFKHAVVRKLKLIFLSVSLDIRRNCLFVIGKANLIRFCWIFEGIVF